MSRSLASGSKTLSSKDRDDTESDSSSSSSDEESESQDINDADIRLAQMKKAALAKGKNRVKDRLAGLKSYDELMREHALQRMRDGLKKILELHTPTELSSICGQLKLKTLQKGHNSIDQILTYATEGGVFSEEKVNSVFSVLWEGALFEYLRSIGHPVHTQYNDPRQTLFNLWHVGGMLDAGKTFVPHFVVREVKKRYTWIQGQDIMNRLDILREKQEKAKSAEKLIISEQNFAAILTYFQCNNDLRGQENLAREYFISELETARSNIDSQREIVKIAQDQLAECERQFITVADHLNAKLCASETLLEKYIYERIAIDADLSRITSITASLTKAFQSRSSPMDYEGTGEQDEDDDSDAGGLTVPSTLHVGFEPFQEMYRPEKSLPTISELYSQLQEFVSFVEERDLDLRDRGRHYVDEIARLEAKVRDLEDQVEFQTSRALVAEKRLRQAEKKIELMTAAEARASSVKKTAADETWRAITRWASRCNEMERAHMRVKPLVLMGISHYHPLVSRICTELCKHLELLTIEEQNQRRELVEMGRADAFSMKYKKFLAKLKEEMSTKSSKTGKKGTRTTIVSASKTEGEEGSAAGGGGSKKGGKKEGGGKKGSKKGASSKKEGKKKKGGGGDDESVTSKDSKDTKNSSKKGGGGGKKKKGGGGTDTESVASSSKAEKGGGGDKKKKKKK